MITDGEDIKYRWEVVRAYEDGQEIDHEVDIAMPNELCTAKDSQEAMAKCHEMNSGISEFIMVDDREFIEFIQLLPHNGRIWNAMYVYRRME